MSTKRSLASVLFIDIVGSTERAAELGDEGWGELLHRFQALVSAEVRRRGGEIITASGDGYLAVFDGTTRAIVAACTMRDRIREELDLTIRAGVHMGKVRRVGGSIEGIGVHIGARVAAQAEPGEVLVSSTVREAESGSDIVFADRGVHVLKGMPEQWRLFAVTSVPQSVIEEEAGGRRPAWTGAAGMERWNVAGLEGWPLAAAGLVFALVLLAAGWLLVNRDGAFVPDEAVATAAEPGIAILPFTVNDPELDRWREGMVNLLATNLDGVAGLRAIDSRTILARWRAALPEGGEADLSTALRVASESGGRYALVGSAVSSGTDLRLVADIYDLEDGGGNLGQEQVEGSPDSIFALVDRLSIAILGRILEEEDEALTKVDLAAITTQSVPAIRAFLEGEALMRQSRFGTAADAYERAIEADSLFALAHFRLFEAYSWQEPGAPMDFDDPLDTAYRLRERLPEREGRYLEVIRRRNDLHPEATSFARQTAVEYPDDPRAWYQLGEILHHLGFQTLTTRSEVEEPFLRATQLDPSFTPGYIHLLDLAFWHADSAAVARLLPAYERHAAGSIYDQGFRTAWNVTFADSATRSATLATLDTLPTFALERAMRMLQHPRFLLLSLRVAPSLGRRANIPQAVFSSRLAAWHLLPAGKLRQTLEIMQDPETFLRLQTLATLYFLHSLGIVEESAMDPGLYAEAFALPPAGEPLAAPLAAASALYAIDQGREDDFELALARARTTADSAFARGDSGTGRLVMGIIEGTNGYRASLRGEIEPALAKLDSAYRATGIPVFMIWAVDILAREGRAEEALRYIEAERPNPYLGILAGPLYERTGDREAAIRAYGWVIDGWAEADPELQDEVRIARRAIARLSTPARG